MTGFEIVKRIDEILKRKNLKRQAVAVAVGIAPNTFSHWSKRKSRPAADTLFKIADFLGVSAEFLLTGKTAEEKINSIPQDVLSMSYEIMTLDKIDQKIIEQTLNILKQRYEKQ